MSRAKYRKRVLEETLTKNPTPKQVAARNSHLKRLALRKQEIYDEFMKRGGSCQFCRKEYPYEIYQWHHIDDEDPSNQRVKSLAGKTPGAERLAEEMAKCVVVCPNCHETFHQGLCCMIDHKELHIDGSFLKTKKEKAQTKDKLVTFGKPVFNPLWQEYTVEIDFHGPEGEEIQKYVIENAESRGVEPADEVKRIVVDGFVEDNKESLEEFFECKAEEFSEDHKDQIWAVLMKWNGEQIEDDSQDNP